jgi:hypothetical protein
MSNIDLIRNKLNELEQELDSCEFHGLNDFDEQLIIITNILTFVKKLLEGLKD